MNQGKIVVGVAVVLGICAGLAGYWWNYRIGHRALAFWGQENARLIRLAPKVEYYQLTPTDEMDKQDPLLKVIWHTDQLSYKRSDRVDLSEARGLIHLRNALLSDDQLNWEAEAAFNTLVVNHVLIFTDEAGKSVTLYFDSNKKTVGAEGKIQAVKMGPLAVSVEQFLARELRRLKEAGPEVLPANSE